MPKVSPAHEKGEPPFEYNQITEHIFLGSNACCTTHFKSALLKKGVVADISMEAERLDAAQGAKYFLWLPTRDHYAPSLEKLRVGAHAMRELHDAKVKMYVHCKNGHGRAPTMVAAYFILMGDTAKDAMAKVKKKRPVIHIEPGQKKRLEQFERWVKKHRMGKNNHI